MRKLWVSAAVLLANLIIMGSAAADSSSVMEVTVHANVAPARYIIINTNNQITEIMSNSAVPVKPEVYMLSITPGHERSLSAAILNQYRTIMGRLPVNNKELVGVLYQMSDPAPVPVKLTYHHVKKPNDTLWFLFKTTGSYLHG